jgi:hypothetical protein
MWYVKLSLRINGVKSAWVIIHGKVDLKIKFDAADRLRGYRCIFFSLSSAVKWTKNLDRAGATIGETWKIQEDVLSWLFNPQCDMFGFVMLGWIR